MNKLRSSALLAGVGLLAACSAFHSDSKKKPLTGERVSVLDLQKHIEPDNKALTAEGTVLPTAWKNAFWPQPGGFPGHAMQNMDLNPGALHQAWQVSIGHGATDRLPLTAQPIVADGHVYTVDRENSLSSFATADGKKQWSLDLRPPKHGDDVIGGGIAYGAGRLFATNGYNEVVCVNPKDGKILWRIHIPTAVRAAPTFAQDKLYVVTLDNHLYALSTTDGAVLWDYAGVGEAAGLVGAASPAADSDIVVPVFTSGEIYALHSQNGEVAWQESLADTSTPGLQALADIRGLPIIDKGAVFAVSFGGRLVSLDERTGDRLWQKDIGSAVTPWLAGNHLYVLSTENELVALGREQGSISWVHPLPRYKDADKHVHPLFWTGPIIAGGRLITAGTNGDMVELNPADGKAIRATHLNKPITLDPIVAGGTLYLLADDGTLMAFR